ncbi:MAG: MFS transporter [Caldilineaceae bacterium]|nr:MFS transporter [Caldilineaceae bacterium]
MRLPYLQEIGHIQPDVWKVMTVSVVVGLGYFGIHTVVFNLYLLRLGYGPEFIGLFNGLAMFGAAISAIPAGMAGRRWGLRPVMLTGYTVWTMMNLLLPQAELLPTAWRTPWLLVTFALIWMSVPLWGVNQTTYLMAITGEVERQHVFALSRAINRLSAMLGSLVAGFLPVWLAGRFELSLEAPTVYRYTLYVAPILYLLIARPLWSLRTVHTPRAAPGQVAARSPIWLFVAMAVFIILSGAAEAVGETYFNVYMDEALQVSPALIGLLIAAAHLLAVAATLAAPLLVKRWGSGTTIFGAGLALGASILFLAYASMWITAGVGFLALMAMASLLFPVRTIYHQEITAPEWRSSMSGVVSLASQLGRALIVLGSGFLIGRMGYGSVFTVAAILTVVGTLFFWVGLELPRRQR